MEKRHSIQAPYHAGQLNTKSQEVLGGALGRVVNPLQIQYVSPSTKLSGRCSLSPSGGNMVQLTDSAAPGFVGPALANDWVVVGGASFLSGALELLDRKEAGTGTTSGAAPTNFNDPAATFLATDVGKTLLIYNGASFLAWKITAFVDVNNITIAGAAFGNETDISYAIVDPKDNFGIYEVDEAVDASNLLVAPILPFPSDYHDQDLSYILASPAQLNLLAGVVAQFGVHWSFDTNIFVDMPAMLLRQTSPTMYLCMEMQDAREGREPRFFFAPTRLTARDSAIIAVSRTNLGGLYSHWRAFEPISIESAFRKASALTSDRLSGFIGRQPTAQIGHEYFPPRLTLKEGGSGFGGTSDRALMLANGELHEQPVQPDTPLLDVPIYPCYTGDRVDRIVAVRRLGSQQIESDLGLGAQDSPVGEVSIQYQVGTAMPSRHGRDNEGHRLKGVSLTPSAFRAGVASDECICRSNQYGVTIDMVSDAAPYANAGITIRPKYSDSLFGEIYTQAPKGSGCRQLQCEVDARGFFHICWIETNGAEEIYYMRLDPQGHDPQNTGVLVTTVDAIDFRMSVAENGRVAIIYRDSSLDMHRVIFRADKDGNYDELVASAQIAGSNMTDVYDVKWNWENDAILVFAIETGSDPALYLIKNDGTEIASYPYPYGADCGSQILVGGCLYVRMVRTRLGEVQVFVSAIMETPGTSQIEILGNTCNGADGLWTRCTPRYFSGSANLIEAVTTDDGKVILLGELSGQAFAITVNEEMLPVNYEEDFISLAGSVLNISASHNPASGDVYYNIINDNGTKDSYYQKLATELRGNMPLHREGYKRPSRVKVDVLAEVHVPFGFNMPRVIRGGYIAADVTPTGPSIGVYGGAEGLAMTDRDANTLGVAASAGVSLTLQHTAIQVKGLLLFDLVKSDGFGPAFDPANIQVYSGNDNNNWTLRTVLDVYRVEGRTYLILDTATTDKYVKVRFADTALVPAKQANHADTSTMSVSEMRVLDSDASAFADLDAGHDDSYMRGLRVLWRSDVFDKVLTVGDGYSSSGDFSGWTGIQAAIHSAMPRVNNTDPENVWPKSNSCIEVLSGVYHVNRPLDVPGGTSLKFAPGALVRDNLNQPSSYVFQSEGFVVASYQTWNKTRQVYLPQSAVHYGIGVGSKVIAEGASDTEYRVIRVDETGRILTLDKPFTSSEILTQLRVLALGVSIDGMTIEARKRRTSVDVTGYQMSFFNVGGVRLTGFNFSDETPAGAEVHKLMLLLECDDVWLEQVRVESPNADEGLRIEKCSRAGGAEVSVLAGAGQGTIIKDCPSYRGISGIKSIGDGTAGNHLVVDGEVFNNPYGRLKTDALGVGLGLPGSTDIGYDEFIKLAVHREGNIQVLNGGIYETLLSMLFVEIATLHAIPSFALSIGDIDNLVTDSIIDAASST